MPHHLPDTLPKLLPQLAVIREEECIGCTKCIQACPVDAIMGAAKQMHTVIGEECIGCGLCLPPCPVDCIDLVDVPVLSPEVQQQKTALAEKRFDAKNVRLSKNKEIKKPVRKIVTISQDEIAAAIARVMIKRGKK